MTAFIVSTIKPWHQTDSLKDVKLVIHQSNILVYTQYYGEFRSPQSCNLGACLHQSALYQNES